MIIYIIKNSFIPLRKQYIYKKGVLINYFYYECLLNDNICNIYNLFIYRKEFLQIYSPNDRLINLKSYLRPRYYRSEKTEIVIMEVISFFQP